MIGTLFKKQMMEVFSWVYQNKKSGKNRTVKDSIGYGALYLLIFTCLGATFYAVADMLCPPLVKAGMGWLYFAIMGLIALFLGVFGSVFNTYASLYKSKDNDFLLAMPIKPVKILLIRLTGVYFTGLMYELIVMIPALIVWFRNAELPAAGVVCTLPIPPVLSVLALVLSALLGWLVALIGGRLKHKNGIVVLLSLVFFAAYYAFFGRSFAILQGILANPQSVGDKVRNLFFPLYHMGMAAEGSFSSMLIFTVIVGALFAAMFRVLSLNFLKMATVNYGEARVQYKEKRTAARSADGALLQKELRRFLGSPTYMLNCGLGIVVMLVSAGALIWKQGMASELLSEVFPENRDIACLIGAAGICLLASMNDMTAPSVSLEGKNLWLAQVLPVSGRQVLMAKLKLHLILTMLPAAALTAAVEWVVKPPPAFAVLIPVAAALFILTMAELGLCLSVKMPNLNWTSEIVPIKQSVGVMVSLLGGWALIALLAGSCYLLSKIMSTLGFLIAVVLLLLAVSALLLHWLRTRGAQRFERL